MSGNWFWPVSERSRMGYKIKKLSRGVKKPTGTGLTCNCPGELDTLSLAPAHPSTVATLLSRTGVSPSQVEQWDPTCFPFRGSMGLCLDWPFNFHAQRLAWHCEHYTNDTMAMANHCDYFWVVSFSEGNYQRDYVGQNVKMAYSTLAFTDCHQWQCCLGSGGENNEHLPIWWRLYSDRKFISVINWHKWVFRSALKHWKTFCVYSFVECNDFLSAQLESEKAWSSVVIALGRPLTLGIIGDQGLQLFALKSAGVFVLSPGFHWVLPLND